MKWKTSKFQTVGSYTAKVVEVIKSGYDFDPTAGITTAAFSITR